VFQSRKLLKSDVWVSDDTKSDLTRANSNKASNCPTTTIVTYLVSYTVLSNHIYNAGTGPSFFSFACGGTVTLPISSFGTSPRVFRPPSESQLWLWTARQFTRQTCEYSQWKPDLTWVRQTEIERRWKIILITIHLTRNLTHFHDFLPRSTKSYIVISIKYILPRFL